ncbi:MAG: ATP-binding protein [Bacteroidales bacterium]
MSVKKLSIQIKIGLLLLFAIILLSATCYVSYRNLSSIVSSIRVEVKPEKKLLTIRTISGDLEKADNSVRIFGITRNTADLKPYYTVVKGIDDKINELRNECLDDSLMLVQTDTIAGLIEDNIVNWNDLLYLMNQNNVIGFLNELGDKINSVTDDRTRQGIIRRVFARNSKSILSDQDLINDIKQFEQKGQISRDRLVARETQLANTSNRIKENLFDLITVMENQVLTSVNETSIEANRLAEKTYAWIILFSVSIGLLTAMVLFIIIRYVRETHSLQLALRKSVTEAEKLAKTRELFVANMSHEIRTPVTAISGFTDQLLHETSDDKVLGSLRIIKSSSDHLARIIDDILDLSRLSSGKLLLENVDFSINRILDEVYRIFESPARRNNTKLDFTVSPGTPEVLRGDPYRLRQIIINLAGNAVKFTDNGTVTFTVTGTPGKSGEINLLMECRDTGIGIDEDKLNLIFEDFTQAEINTSRKYGGTGLGLSIVRKLVQLHGGTIECKSKKNFGTTITCSLPFRVGDRAKIKQDVTPPPEIPEEIRKMKMLVVDDEEYNRLLFKKILDRWKISCDVAVDSMEAFDLLKDNSYDILFMDFRMPGLDGLRATQFIRSELGISEARMKVICISAVSLGSDWDKYRQAGMNTFLQKPFTEEMLLSAILSVTENREPDVSKIIKDENIILQQPDEGINLDSLSHIAGGDRQFMSQMLISFIQTTGKGLSEMQEAVATGHWDSVGYLAHKLLPPCRHLGATKLAGLLSKIESAISENRGTGSIDKFVRESADEYNSVRTILEEYIAKLK